jgi:hypothetical protein
MIFGCISIKIYAMKKLWILIFLTVMMLSCSTSKETSSARSELRRDKKLTGELLVKNAVESRKYIIKLERLYSAYGAFYDLAPRANYIIIDGEKAAISTAYFGRQYDIRPIGAINTRGKAEDYEVTTKLNKGKYEISLKVDNGGPNSFRLFLTISNDGQCYASVSSLKIDNVRYSGYLVPISDRNPQTQQSPEGAMI